MLPRILFAIVSLLIPLIPGFALADTSDPKMQMLFVGAAPESGAPGELPSELPVIAIQSLPTAEEAQQAIFAARLRANPVSTFVAEPSETHAQFEQFFLVTSVGLTAGDGGHKITLSDDSFALDEFAGRVSALVGAFNPKHRRIGLVHMTDPDDVFPMAIGDIQTALNSIGFDMIVLMIGNGADGQCAQTEALHYSLISGLADRAPFGDADGISTAREVESYLTHALNRQTERDPVCGPRYSVLLKSSNDPARELVAYKGRSVFTEMETKLYNETFEAMFLLESDNREGVHEFLASCLYCPNERALTERLRDMEEFARTNALEADIWQRIQNDQSPARLAIYLENCALCTFRDEVTAKIAELDAKAAAYDAEALAYASAVEVRDLVSLRAYVTDCVACAFQDEARVLVSTIEADEAYQRETLAFAQAMEARDVALLSAYLDDCTICESRDTVANALEIETKRVELAEPCLAMAAVPQLGGPRQLGDIDTTRARQLCTEAAVAFPEDGQLLTTLGRIAQANGDFDTAKKSYIVGMGADVPSAYGLAAYTHYAPPEGTEINLAEAEKLAIIGAERGDWLSQEILTVLYSKGLVPGRTPEEAFAIAQNIADEGNAMAEFFVGYYHLTGTGTVANTDEAEVWLSKSVEQGYTHAKSFLAEVYETGPGGIPQPDRAADLYWSALQDGDETAATRLTTQLASRDREVIRLIQQKLGELGNYRGGADGIAGPGTVTAIREYAQSVTAQGG